MLLRYFLSFKGRLSVNRYRAFLLWYFLAVVPIFTVLFFAFVWLGWGSKTGFLRSASRASAYAASLTYLVGCLWPLAAATTRRMHDLGQTARENFFVVSPKKTWKLGRAILSKRGEEKTNVFGPDPGTFE